MKDTMKKLLLITLVGLLAFCSTSCRKLPSRYIVGQWEVTDVTIKATVPYVLPWNKGAILTFNSNGTAVFTLQGIDYELNYTAQRSVLNLSYTYEWPNEAGVIVSNTEYYALNLTLINSRQLILDSKDGDNLTHIECVRL